MKHRLFGKCDEGCEYCVLHMLLCHVPIQTLNWTAAEKGITVFYVNATNDCGASSIACFVVEPFCQVCKFRI